MKNLTNETMEIIGTYMNDEIREELNSTMCGESNLEFLKAYCELDNEMYDLLKEEFSDVYEILNHADELVKF